MLILKINKITSLNLYLNFYKKKKNGIYKKTTSRKRKYIYLKFKKHWIGLTIELEDTAIKINDSSCSIRRKKNLKNGQSIK